VPGEHEMLLGGNLRLGRAVGGVVQGPEIEVRLEGGFGTFWGCEQYICSLIGSQF
jgi:hypothetical protein